MYTFIVENADGNQLRLTQNKDYDILSIAGLTPPAATINTSNIIGAGGAQFNSSRIGMRNLVITLVPRRSAEENRIRLYEFFRVKGWVKCYYHNNHRNVSVEGYVETLEAGIFEKGHQIQISILCPEPFWLAASEIVYDISKITALFEFPFSIDDVGIPFSEYNEFRVAEVLNDGDVEGGMMIELRLASEGLAVNNPTIYNADTREMFKINEALSSTRQVIYIDTEKKLVYEELDGVYNRSLFSRMDINSQWLTVRHGTNFFYYAADQNVDGMMVTMRFTPRYKGV